MFIKSALIFKSCCTESIRTAAGQHKAYARMSVVWKAAEQRWRSVYTAIVQYK